MASLSGVDQAIDVALEPYPMRGCKVFGFGVVADRIRIETAHRRPLHDQGWPLPGTECEEMSG